MLSEKVNPNLSAVLVIDAQNDYCSVGGALDRNGRDISVIQKTIPRLKEFLAKSRKSEVPIIYTKTIYAGPHKKFVSQVWLEQSHRRRKGAVDKLYCVDGTWGSDIVDDLKPGPKDYVVVKHNYSAFFGTELEAILNGESRRTIILTGFTTNACVASTAMDGFMRNYYTLVASDCVATYSEKLHEASLLSLDTFFAEVTTSQGIVNCW